MSSNKLSRKNYFELEMKNSTTKQPIILSIVIVLYHLLVLGYLITLEGVKCNCIMDWRHNYLKYYTIIMIFITLIILITTPNYNNMNIGMKLMQTIILFAFFINVWCLYTYIGDLDKTNCKCAIEDQKDIHYFLYIWRYILVISIILAFITLMVSLLFLIKK
jgi:hypothetical protein